MAEQKMDESRERTRSHCRLIHTMPLADGCQRRSVTPTIPQLTSCACDGVDAVVLAKGPVWVKQAAITERQFSFSLRHTRLISSLISLSILPAEEESFSLAPTVISPSGEVSLKCTEEFRKLWMSPHWVTVSWLEPSNSTCCFVYFPLTCFLSKRGLQRWSECLIFSLGPFSCTLITASNGITKRHFRFLKDKMLMVNQYWVL